MKLIKQETEDLCRDIIENCEDWTQKEHSFVRDDRSIAIWTSNIPILDIDLYPSASAFNIFEKVRVKRAINKSRIKKALKGRVLNSK